MSLRGEIIIPYENLEYIREFIPVNPAMSADARGKADVKFRVKDDDVIYTVKKVKVLFSNGQIREFGRG